MKKITIITALFALLCTANTAFSQTEFILKAGINSSAFDTELEDGNNFDEARVGWNVGFDLRFGSDNTLFLQPGIHYNEFTARLIGTSIDIGAGQLDFEERTTFKTIKIPINLGINLIENDIFDLYGIVGVVPTALLSSDTFEEVDFDDDDVKNISVGADAGIGIDLFNRVNISLNYEIGLTDFFEAKEGRINMLTAGVGIIF